MATHTPRPGEHGYRVTPPRFCADCGKDVSEGCYCCAPTTCEDGKTRCSPCYHVHGASGRSPLEKAAPDLLEALDALVARVAETWAPDADPGLIKPMNAARAAIAKARKVTP